MLALITICILCFSLDTNLIQELSQPHLNTLWIPCVAWTLAVFIFALLAKHTKYLVYLLHIVYLGLFLPITFVKLNAINTNFSIQTLLIFTVAIFLAFIESFPPSLIQQKVKQLQSFKTSSFKIIFQLLFTSIQSYILLILFSCFYLITVSHPLFNGSTNALDQAIIFIVSIPFIYATRRL